MTGATARIFTLISTTTSLPPLLHRPSSSSLLLLRRLTSFPPPPSTFPTRSHSPLLDPNPHPNTSPSPLPWPEWSHFLDRISVPGSGFGYRYELHSDEFATSTQLTHAFFNDATAFLAFAHQHPSLLWSLPIEDIHVIAENVSPSLFKDADGATSRMRSFLAGGATHVPESDKPSTVDLMKFLLSYVHMSIFSSEEVHRSSEVESSVRKLFSELVKSRGTSPEPVAPVHAQFPEGNALGPRSTGNNIEMKRGDWICTRCSFMNFAKNKNCLQCEELRPKKFVTGGEWECPQCDFFNFSRNVVCLRCDCKKPNVIPLQSLTTVSGLGANISSVKSNTEKPLADSEGEQQQWFTKITQLEKSSDLTTSTTDEAFSKFMQARDNRVSSRSSNLTSDGNPDGLDLKLGELLAQKSSFSYTSNKDGDSGESTRDLGSLDTSNFTSSQYGSLSDSSSSRETFTCINEQLSGEELPEIMPMRAGENRFVISRKKDRSLTSPSYKRRVAMEQTGGSNHVPFVPFPPGYFAQDKSESTHSSSMPEASGDARTALRKSTVVSQQTGAINCDPGKAGESYEHKAINSYEASKNMAQTSQASSSYDGYSKTESSSGTDFSSASQAREKSSVEEMSRCGMSLEGSAVKEVDPLDMSEEAKAERWFRRVAQIKDISELSQIPDKDFPSIMPLRKGVNRFVVSKRKTPLERRLTSSQYRTNLPITNSETEHDRDKTQSS